MNTRRTSLLPNVVRASLVASMLAGAAASCAVAGDDVLIPSAPAPAGASGAPDGGTHSGPDLLGAEVDAASTDLDAAPVMPGVDAAPEAAVDAGPACDGGLAACGGACVDLQTDNQNCGGCGLTCASCTAGECVTTIFSEGGMPLGLAVDATRAYWVDFTHFNVMSARLDGSEPTVLATDQVYPKGIAVAGSSVYWATAGAGIPYGTVVRAALDGSDATPLVTDLPAPQRLIVAADNRAYWVNGYPLGSDAVMSVPMAGGGTTTLASATSGPGAIASNATDLCWVDNDTHSLMTAPFAGPARVLAQTSDVTELVMSATHAIWTEWGNGRVMMAALAGGAPAELAQAQTGSPWGIAIDEQFVYWIENGGAIVKAPLSGGPARVVATGLGGVSQYLVVSGNSLYWTSGTSVMKLTPK